MSAKRNEENYHRLSCMSDVPVKVSGSFMKNLLYNPIQFAKAFEVINLISDPPMQNCALCFMIQALRKFVVA